MQGQSDFAPVNGHRFTHCLPNPPIDAHGLVWKSGFSTRLPELDSHQFLLVALDVFFVAAALVAVLPSLKAKAPSSDSQHQMPYGIRGRFDFDFNVVTESIQAIHQFTLRQV